jgi:hypothetical protein
MTKLLVEDWRLTPGFVALIALSGKIKKIWLCARDKKAYKTALQKEIPSDIATKELLLNLNEVELKFARLEKEWGDEVGVFIRNPELFPDDSWYQVMNFYKNHLINFILDTSSEKGEFPGQTFEAIFSESEPTLVSFISPDMSKYHDYFEEMKRRINCEYGKKVKKWTPGHRYDTLKETFYYLGQQLSRKSTDTNSEFLEDADMVPVYLCTSVLKEGDKTISDILTTRAFGLEPQDIKILRTLPSAVDSGEALANDLNEDIRVYWDSMIDVAIDSCKDTMCGGYTTYKDTRKIFDVLSVQSPGYFDYPESCKEKISGVIKALCTDIVFLNYNVLHADKNLDLNSSQTLDENIRAVIRNLNYKTRDPNLLRVSYYDTLMKKAGVDVNILAASALNSFSESSLCTDFDTFRRYSFYFDMRKQELDITSKQRVKSAIYKSDIKTVESILGNGELSSAIKSLVSFAKDNCGIGVDLYSIYNVGTKKSPNEYIHCTISLQNIIDFLGGPEKLTDQLKSEILGSRFTRIIVNVDKDAAVE